MKRYSRVYASVNLDAAIENMEAMHRLLKKDTSMFAVIKTDGYGHGATELARVLEPLPYLHGFCVATVEEGVILRNHGIKKPILILGFAFPDEYEIIVEQKLEPAVFTYDMAVALSEAATRKNQDVAIHIAVDTGMSRIGYQVEKENAGEIAQISKLPHIIMEGIFTHFARADEKDNGCIINTAIQAASEPNQLSICVNKANYTHDMIVRPGKFTVSVLSQNAQFELFKHFGFQSGRDTNKFETFEKCSRGENGIYYITEGTNAYISVTVNKTEDLGSHTMFIGEITDMEVISNIPSATYDYYQNNIKPKPEDVGKAEDGQTIWRCRICGYEYVGEELPDDFICPLCKHPASDFEKVVKKTEVK